MDANPFDEAHFDRAGAEWDRILVHLEPVTHAVLARLPATRRGGLTIDLACGTGEPGLTLARRARDARVLGLDSSAGMIAAARRKSEEEALTNAGFEVGSIERLPLAEGGADAAVSRFGLLMFGDPAGSAAELARVLRRGASFGIAVWEGVAANTFLDASLEALRLELGPEHVPDFAWLDALAEPGRRERWLRDAGFATVASEAFTWDYLLPDAAAAWGFMAGRAGFGALVERLSEARRANVRRHLTERLSAYRRPEGYRVPHSCRIYWGTR